MVLLSKRESHLGPKRAIDNKSDARTRTHSKGFAKITNRFRAFRAQCFGARCILSSLLRGMEGGVRIENCLRSALRYLKNALNTFEEIYAQVCRRFPLLGNMILYLFFVSETPSHGS